MFWFRFKNTWTIFWVDLWLRQEVHHWTNDSLGPEYRNSFFYKRRLKQDNDGIIWNPDDPTDTVKMALKSQFDRDFHSRREIIRRIDNDTYPIKTFLYRQWAWFLYSRTGKLPSIVFNFK